MLASVLNSERAIKINIQIIDTFIALRRQIASAKAEVDYNHLKKTLMLYIDKNDSRVKEIINVLNILTQKEEEEPKKIGFIQ